MPDAIITVENLGKRYRLGQRSNERYTALRDVITEKAKNLFRRNGRKSLTSDLGSLPATPKPCEGGTSARASREEIWALRDVSFEVKRGEVVGIIGRNGAGKSTLLKILSRITEPTTGRVRLRGRVASLLEVGTGFHPELTGRENIYLNGAILGMTRAEIQKKFDEIVAFAEIEKFLDTPVKRYSSGMYVRLAFAVAAHLEPEIFVVDEVLAVGDAEFQKKCLGKMQDVAQQEGRTILFVSHNLAQIEKLSTRGLLLSQGVLTLQGQPEEVVQAYMETGAKQSEGPALSRTELTVPEHGIRLYNFDIKAEDQEFIRTGCACRLGMTAYFDEAIRNPGFIFSLRTLGGAELLRISTSPISGVDTGLCKGEVRSELRIAELPLAAGIYQIAAGMSIPNVDYLIPLTDIGRFAVETADYYRSGFAIENKFGVLVARHRWEIKHSTPAEYSKTSDVSIKSTK